LIGLAIEGMATAIPVDANPEHPLTAQQIRRILDGLDALPPRSPFKDAYEWERCMILGCLQAVARNQVSLPYLTSLDHVDNTTSSKTDWSNVFARSSNLNIAYRRINESYDAMSALPSDEFESMIKTIERWTTSWNTIPKLMTANGRGEIVGNVFVAIFTPAIMAFEEAVHRLQCAENMKRLTLALLLYEKEHGSLPDGDWRAALMEAGVPAQWFRCPSCHELAENETVYVMIGNVPNAVSSPNQILLAEVLQPQKLGEGDGRIPFEKATFWQRGIARPLELRPKDFDGFGSAHTGCTNLGFRSGAVRAVADTIDSDVLQKLLDGSATELP
jgi:hypothetical protein